MVDAALQRLNIDRQVVLGWIEEEKVYLASKKSGEYVERALECDYVEALQQYKAAR